MDTSRATLGLTAGALALGLLAGLALGGSDDEKAAQPTGPGPTKTIAGVPVGFARSQDGAVSAAAAYTQSIGALALATMEDRNAALVAMTDPQALPQVREALEPGLATLANGLGATRQDAVIRSAPVGFRVGTYSNDAAEIYLWAVGIVGNTTSAPPSASWGTTKVLVRWVNGDWKLAANVEQQAGPTPQGSGAPSAPQDFVTSVRDLRSFTSAPAR